MTSKHNRLDDGEAWVICGTCGSKICSFDGNEDEVINCPDKEDCSGIDTDYEWRNVSYSVRMLGDYLND